MITMALLFLISTPYSYSDGCWTTFTYEQPLTTNVRKHFAQPTFMSTVLHLNANQLFMFTLSKKKMLVYNECLSKIFTVTTSSFGLYANKDGVDAGP